MNDLVLVLALVTAVGAAARSTWSPCGLSMLSSITPLGEQGRGHRYGATASFFLAGAILGGLTLGGAAAVAATGIAALKLSPTFIAALAALAATAAVLLDAGLGPLRFPVFRRQVNERWLDQFRSWFYGAGFGWQIGVGFATYIMTAAVGLTAVLAALTASWWMALAVGTVFGAARGMVILANRRATSPRSLVALHQRFDALEEPVRLACLASMASVALVAAGAAAPVGLLAAGVALVAIALVARRQPTAA